METNVIYNEECLQGMNERIPDNSIDMILADLPYGTTACKWDSIIPLEQLWNQYKRIVKNKTAIVLTATQPFTSKLVMSNLDVFKHSWIWNKKTISNPMQADYKPLRQHEDVLVFCYGNLKYKPQKTHKGLVRHWKQSSDTKYIGGGNEGNTGTAHGKYPKTILTFKPAKFKTTTQHPTQKPIELFQYLIKTYTDKDNIVLDNVIGSGTTAIAAKALDRKYIGFEQDEEYYEIAQKRISEVQKELI